MMNINVAIDILTSSIHRLVERNPQENKYGFIDPSEISADIIANGALAIIEKRNQRFIENNIKDDALGIDPRETLMKNLKIWMRAKDSLRDDNEYKSIADRFGLASLQVVNGLTAEDANYVQDEIFKLAEDGNVEEVLSNYFLARHGFDPFT